MRTSQCKSGKDKSHCVWSYWFATFSIVLAPYPWSHKNGDGYVNYVLARTSHLGDHEACNLRSLGARTANRSTKTIPIIPPTAAAWGALQTSAIAPEDMLPKANA